MTRTRTLYEMQGRWYQYLALCNIGEEPDALSNLTYRLRWLTETAAALDELYAAAGWCDWYWDELAVDTDWGHWR